MGAFAELDQRVGERRIRVHRDVATDVMEDVGLGEVVQHVAITDGDRGGELAVAQAVEEPERRHVAADGLGAETGSRPHELVHVLEPRHARRVQRECGDAIQEALVRIARPARRHPLVQATPGVVVRVAVLLVRLHDVQLSTRLGRFDVGGLGGGQSGRSRRWCRHRW